MSYNSENYVTMSHDPQQQHHHPILEEEELLSQHKQRMPNSKKPGTKNSKKKRPDGGDDAEDDLPIDAFHQREELRQLSILGDLPRQHNGEIVRPFLGFQVDEVLVPGSRRTIHLKGAELEMVLEEAMHSPDGTFAYALVDNQGQRHGDHHHHHHRRRRRHQQQQQQQQQLPLLKAARTTTTTTTTTTT